MRDASSEFDILFFLEGRLESGLTAGRLMEFLVTLEFVATNLH